MLGDCVTDVSQNDCKVSVNTATKVSDKYILISAWGLYLLWLRLLLFDRVSILIELGWLLNRVILIATLLKVKIVSEVIVQLRIND